MKFVFASYIVSKNYTRPEAWLERIKAYTGILEALARQHEIISIEQINYEGECVKNSVTYQFKKFSAGKSYFPLKLNRYIAHLKPDVVFIQSLHFPLQVMLLRLMLGGKPKIIIQNHAEKPFTGLKKGMLKLADKFVNAYLFTSKPMGMEWVTTGNLKSTEKVHEVMELSSVFYPVDKAEAKAKIRVGNSTIFLWVGRLDENKDPLTVVEAFLDFAAIQPDVNLYMLYHTEELLNDVRDLLKDHPQAGAIRLIGKVPNPDMLYWYNSADFIVSGSHYEGSGTAVCEAMSCGCIPIVTDIFSFRVMTDNGRLGLLYPPGKESELLARLKQAASLALSVQREKVLAYFKSNLSFEAIADRIEKIALL